MVAPALEIVVDGVFDLVTKYDGSAEFRIPADVDDVTRKELEDARRRVLEELERDGVFLAPPVTLVIGAVAALALVPPPA